MDTTFTRICIYFFMLMGLLPISSSAQDIDRTVYSPAGKNAANTSISVSYTVGEPIVFTGISTNAFLTQGFEQPDQITITTGISPLNYLMDINAFPNPVTGPLYVNINSNMVIPDLTLELFDLYGKKINVSYEASSPALNHVFSLDLSNISSGIYFIKVTSLTNHLNKTFKIIKE